MGGESFSAAFHKNDPKKLLEIAKEAINYPTEIISKFSPSTYTIINFNNNAEVNLAKKLFKNHLLGDEYVKKTWQVKWNREFDMTNDSDTFTSTPTEYCLLEGRTVNRYDYKDKTYVSGRARTAIWDTLDINEKEEWRPQWWVKKKDAINAISSGNMNPGFKLVSCDVTTPNTSRTLLTTIVPQNMGCGNSLNVLKVIAGDEDRLNPLLCSLLNSMVLDFIAKLKIKLHANHHILNSLPIPDNLLDSIYSEKLIINTVKLVAIDDSYDALCKKFNVKRVTNLDERNDLIIENEALVCKLYSLNKEDTKFLLDRFSKYSSTIPDFESTFYTKFKNY